MGGEANTTQPLNGTRMPSSSSFSFSNHRTFEDEDEKEHEDEPSEDGKEDEKNRARRRGGTIYQTSNNQHSTTNIQWQEG